MQLYATAFRILTIEIDYNFFFKFPVYRPWSAYGYLNNLN